MSSPIMTGTNDYEMSPNEMSMVYFYIMRMLRLLCRIVRETLSLGNVKICE